MRSARRALIAGLGLIGGSIGIALRRSGWRVVYVDPAVSEEEAHRAGAADERVHSFDVAAEIIVLATPAGAAVDAIRLCSTLVTSVCSVMGPLRAAADASGVAFVAGHPLAGSQDRGLRAARGDLFTGASWFVDREEPLVHEIIAACGAREELVDTLEHDRAVALTSHLPQILSTALAAYLHDQKIDLRFAGPGLRTFLRLSGSAGSVWSPIITANREHLEPHAREVARLIEEIAASDPDDAFAKANAFFEGLSP